jgi:hypothetical protein
MAARGRTDDRRVRRIAAGVVAFVKFAYTPTESIRVSNDTTRTVTLDLCASDPATISPRSAVTIDPNVDDANASCLVSIGGAPRATACLLIPTTRYETGSTVRVSQAVALRVHRPCGR